MNPFQSHRKIFVSKKLSIVFAIYAEEWHRNNQPSANYSNRLPKTSVYSFWHTTCVIEIEKFQ